MNFGDGIEIEDSSLGLIALTIITIFALFSNHALAAATLALLAALLFKEEIKSIIQYVFDRFGLGAR